MPNILNEIELHRGSYHLRGAISEGDCVALVFKEFPDIKFVITLYTFTLRDRKKHPILTHNVRVEEHDVGKDTVEWLFLGLERLHKPGYLRPEITGMGAVPREKWHDVLKPVIEVENINLDFYFSASFFQVLSDISQRTKLLPKLKPQLERLLVELQEEREQCRAKDANIRKIFSDIASDPEGRERLREVLPRELFFLGRFWRKLCGSAGTDNFDRFFNLMDTGSDDYDGCITSNLHLLAVETLYRHGVEQGVTAEEKPLDSEEMRLVALKITQCEVDLAKRYLAGESLEGMNGAPKSRVREVVTGYEGIITKQLENL